MSSNKPINKRYLYDKLKCWYKTKELPNELSMEKYIRELNNLGFNIFRNKFPKSWSDEVIVDIMTDDIFSSDLKKKCIHRMVCSKYIDKSNKHFIIALRYGDKQEHWMYQGEEYMNGENFNSLEEWNKVTPITINGEYYRRIYRKGQIYLSWYNPNAIKQSIVLMRNINEKNCFYASVKACAPIIKL